MAGIDAEVAWALHAVAIRESADMGYICDGQIEQHVGDADVDIMTARNAGMKCISVTWGFRDEEFLKEHGATEMIERPIELLSLI